MTAIVIDGLVIGAQWALLATGMTLVFGLAGVINLAYGQLVVVVAVAVDRLLQAGWLWPWAAVAGIGVGIIAAIMLDVSALRPLRHLEGEARVLGGLLLTLAVAFILDGVLVTLAPYTALTLVVDRGAVTIAAVSVRVGNVIAFGIAAAVVVVVAVVLARSRMGRQIRAVSADPVGAQLIAISVTRVRRIVVAASGALAAVVAVTRGLSSAVGAADGFDLTVMALIVAVVGGLGSVKGAWLAGLVLGLVYAAMTAWVGTALTTVAMLAAAAVAIVIRGARPVETAR